MSEKTCDVCKNMFYLTNNQSGLVFNDRFFVCESCSSHMSEDEIECWTKSIMQDPEHGMPIGLWLIHEHNKDKPLFSQKK